MAPKFIYLLVPLWCPILHRIGPYGPIPLFGTLGPAGGAKGVWYGVIPRPVGRGITQNGHFGWFGAILGDFRENGRFWVKSVINVYIHDNRWLVDISIYHGYWWYWSDPAGMVQNGHPGHGWGGHPDRTSRISYAGTWNPRISAGWPWSGYTHNDQKDHSGQPTS
jgi:hypothetical protein